MIVSANFLKKTNLYLVGMMGSGKSTVGSQLAQHLGYGFLDTDTLIEKIAGKPITEIFAQAGEGAFRQLETQVLAQVSAHTAQVVATGGGIVTQPMNWSYLRHGVVIWLDVPTAVLVSRLAGDTTRPLLSETDMTSKLETLLGDRSDRYAQADICLKYAEETVEKTCDRIIALLKQNLRPDPKLAVGQVVVNQSDINTPVVPSPS